MLALRMISIAALLATAACAGSNRPARLGDQHPPAEDFSGCPGEPAALTDEQVLADADGSAEGRFNDEVLVAGRCDRDALGRVCWWHADRGSLTLRPVCQTRWPRRDR